MDCLEMEYQILALCDVGTIFSARLVCRRWSHIVGSSYFWKRTEMPNTTRLVDIVRRLRIAYACSLLGPGSNPDVVEKFERPTKAVDSYKPQFECSSPTQRAVVVGDHVQVVRPDSSVLDAIVVDLDRSGRAEVVWMIESRYFLRGPLRALIGTYSIMREHNAVGFLLQDGNRHQEQQVPLSDRRRHHKRCNIAPFNKASENKGPAVKTFDSLQCMDAKDFRSGDGRRWLQFADDRGQRLFTPWADVEGRPLWALQSNDAAAQDNRSSVTAPLMASVKLAEREDGAGCAMRGCRQRAHSKCERCNGPICLKHYVKYRSGYRSYDYCPPCADRTRRLLFLVLAVAVVAAVAGGLALYFTSR
ncbi:hypothetical protein pkur_cds_150 [Pandoravirus kuranda]|uniref:F-box domain-containing protein n=1 Tax=Pandoravirus kuranda TaxID=3019033 RepID=A0AA95J6F2_9VIRU|nr:hypothetical protein pkur_cds_150 [Pandoravirus kuranda]